MDIKIGFTESPRELVIQSEQSRDELVAQLKQSLTNSEGLLELGDDKGRTYLVNAAEVAYVEIGAATARQVGFGGI